MSKIDVNAVFKKFGLDNEMAQFNKHAKVSAGAHAKFVRACIAKAYSIKSNEATTELMKSLILVSSSIDATFAKATRWVIAECGIEKLKGGGYAVKDYAKQEEVTVKLADRSFTPVSAYEEYARTEAKTKRAERAKNPLGETNLENFGELKATVSALADKFEKMSKKVSALSYENEDELKARNEKRDFLEAQCLEFRALTRILDLAVEKNKKLAELEAVLKELN